MVSQRAQELGFLAVAGGLAALLVASSTSSFLAARELSDALVRGEGEIFFQRLREALPAEGPPTQVALEAFVGAWEPEGLRGVGLVGPEGPLLAVGIEEAPGSGPGPSLEPEWIDGSRVRLERPLGPPRGAPPPGPPGRAPLWRLEYEPRLTVALQRRALRDLAVGSAVAAALLVSALVFHRLRRRARQSTTELAERRHLAALGEMSAVMAHEIRNPLASLKGHAQLLEEQLAGDERKLGKARRIVDEAVRLERLTSSLLDFVRAGKVKRGAVDPRALARRAAEVTDAGRVEVVEARAPAEWRLDGLRVEQALTNLLRNALQVSPPGTPVQLKVAEEGGGLLFAVSDRGPGVPADLRPRIFEPFVSGRTQGTGLGLAVVRRVAELHGGRAEVRDRPGGGAEFMLWIPPLPGGEP